MAHARPAALSSNILSMATMSVACTVRPSRTLPAGHTLLNRALSLSESTADVVALDNPFEDMIQGDSLPALKYCLDLGVPGQTLWLRMSAMGVYMWCVHCPTFPPTHPLRLGASLHTISFSTISTAANRELQHLRQQEEPLEDTVRSLLAPDGAGLLRIMSARGVMRQRAAVDARYDILESHIEDYLADRIKVVLRDLRKLSGRTSRQTMRRRLRRWAETTAHLTSRITLLCSVDAGLAAACRSTVEVLAGHSTGDIAGHLRFCLEVWIARAFSAEVDRSVGPGAVRTFLEGTTDSPQVRRLLRAFELSPDLM